MDYMIARVKIAHLKIIIIIICCCPALTKQILILTKQILLSHLSAESAGGPVSVFQICLAK